MDVSIHNITAIKTEQRHHKGGMAFYCLNIEVDTYDALLDSKGTQSIRLFSSQPITLVNPEIKVIE